MLFKTMSIQAKHVFIILAATFICFAPVLGNGFVGDDEVVIVRNTFYESPKNLVRIFSSDYNTRGMNIATATLQDNGSGSVAYRPVLTLTYFLDRALWGLNPFGYHAFNLLLHLANTVLIYYLLLYLFQKPGMALFTSLLFALHPIQAEAVANIGFRADPLSTLFVLLSVYGFARSYDGTKIADKSWYLLSIGAFFLGMFTKESAIVTPVLLVGYAWVFHNRNLMQLLKDCFKIYLPFGLVALFYLYVYFYIFPNPALGEGVLDALPLGERIVTIAHIHLAYLQDLCFPFQLKMLPGLYAPTVGPGGIIRTLLLLFLIGVLVVGVFRSQVSIVRFSLFWFLVSMLPVSNIIPVTNPMAHRFLYLPSIGFLIFVGIMIHQFALNPKFFPNLKHLGLLTKLAILGILTIYTAPLCMMWKNNYMVGKELIENRSEHYLGYFLVGIEYTKAFDWDRSVYYFEEAHKRGMDDPRIYYMLGLGYSFIKSEKAYEYFQQSIEKFPGYGMPYGGYGRLLLLNGKTEEALPYLKKYIQLTPAFTAHGYLIEAYLMLGQRDKAQEVYLRSKGFPFTPPERNTLDKFMQKNRTFQFPIDIGI